MIKTAMEDNLMIFNRYFIYIKAKQQEGWNNQNDRSL